MTAKRDEAGRLLCRRPGCNNVRTWPRYCEEHGRAIYEAQMDAIRRAESWQAPWRKDRK